MIEIQLWRDHAGHYWKEAHLGLRLLYGPYPTRDAAKAGAQALLLRELQFTDVMLPPVEPRMAPKLLNPTHKETDQCLQS